MEHLQIILLFILSHYVLTISSMPQSDHVVFEGEERRHHKRRRRPCRGRFPNGRAEEERTFFDLSYVNVNNNNYYLCGSGSTQQQNNPGGLLGSHHQRPGSSGHFSGSGGLFGGSHSRPTNSNSRPTIQQDEITDEYHRPDPPNTVIGIAEGVQNTVVGVTNAVTGTIQDVVRPSPNRQPSNQETTGGSTTTSKPDIPVHEIYDEIEPDPYQNYKPGQYVIGNNPVTGQYSLGVSPSNILKQLNRGIDSFVNPFLELFY